MGNHATTNFFGDELVTNGDLESSSSSPTMNSVAFTYYNGSGARSTDFNNGGSNSYKFTGGNQNDHNAKIIPNDSSLVGKTLSISVDVYTPTSGGSSGNIDLRVVNHAGSVTTLESTSTKDAWVTLNGTFVYDGTSAQPINIQWLTVSSIMYVDNITIKEVGISSSGFTTAQNEPTIPQIPLVKYNEKMLFDGVDDKITATIGSSVLSSYTISCWVVAHSLTNFTRLVQVDNSNYRFLGLHGNGTIISGYNDGSWSELFTSNSISVGELHHVVLVDNDTNTTIYIDGVAETLSNSIQVDGSNFYIGTYGGSANFFNGVIDDISYFNTALSSTQVQELFNDGVALDATTHSQSANLIGYWRNDGVTTWTDRSTNSNHGNVSGSPDSITIREELNSNKDGLGFPLKNADSNVLRISQGDDYVNVGKSIGNLLGDSCQAFSYECWFKVPDTNVDDGIISFTDDLSGTTGVTLRLSSNRIVWTFKLDGSYENIYNGFTSTEWNHVAVVYDGSNYANTKLYLNGTAVQTAGSSSFPSSQNFANTNLYIGVYYGSNYHLKSGMVDEIRVYNKTLSADEVSKNYKHQKGKHK
jgi:hypothetical protein